MLLLNSAQSPMTGAKSSGVVIRFGFSGLNPAACLANAGWSVNAYEKKPQIDGRARQVISNGYTFDMGPIWYWIPEVFEISSMILVTKLHIFMT